MSVEITPMTKIGEMLDAYPDLEAELIRIAPVFKKLKNPVLRRTVAKVATVQKAASVAGIDTRELVAQLRRAAGQGKLDVAIQDGETFPEPPETMRLEGAKVSIDADAMLAAGEVPLPKVIDAARGLAAGEAVAVTSSFEPTPLLEAMRKQGYEVFVRRVSPDRIETFIRRM